MHFSEFRTQTSALIVISEHCATYMEGKSVTDFCDEYQIEKGPKKIRWFFQDPVNVFQFLGQALWLD